MLGEWSGASVEPGNGKPTPDIWSPVDVPGRPSAFADAEAAAYLAEFDDPRDPDEERAVLELRGLYAHARVWLNDDLIGSHDAYFRPFRFSFEPRAENELLVVCRRPEDRFGGIHDTNRVPGGDSGPGIWWGVSLETHPETFIYDIRARSRLVEGDAKIDVECVVESETGVDDRLTFSLRPEGEFQSRGMMDRATVEAGPGERVTVEHTIEVRDPSLWWPRELGPQHRYAVRAKLDGKTRSVTTGLCSVARDENGLSVNGRTLPARGINLLDATTDDVDAAVDANANLVRVSAHAAPQRVYEKCCNEGVLVWQDLPLTGPGSFDIERGRDVAAALVAAYDHHPCLAAFGVHDGPVDRSGEPVGAGFLDRLRLRWQAWQTEYDHGPADTVAAELPEDRPVFPVVGPFGTAPDAAELYPGWDHGDATDIDWLCDRYDLDDVVAAFGAGALGTGDPEEPAGFDSVKHDAHVGADADVETSQQYQAQVIERVAETLRRRNTTLAAVDALRDTGDAGMGILERDGTEKLGYETVANAFEPVQAMLVEPTAGVNSDVAVVNDTGEAVAGSLAWQVGDDEGEASVDVDAHDTRTVASVTLPADADSIEMILSAGDHMVENHYRL